MLKGELLAQANKAFNAAMGRVDSPVSRIALAMRSGRKKMPELFAQFRAVHNQLDSMVPLPIIKHWFDISARVPVNKKKTKTVQSKRSVFWYMSVEDEETDSPDYGLFTPRYMRYDLRETDFKIQHRRSPFCFAVDHVAYRFRDSELPLDFQSQEFVTTLLASMVVSRAVSNKFFAHPNASPVPVIMPHPHGIFMGYAEQVPEDYYNFSVTLNLRRNNMPQTGTVTKANDTWAPQCRIVLKTFVPETSDKGRGCSPSQLRLRDALLNVVVAEKNRDGINTLMDTFQSTDLFDVVHHEAIADIDKEMKAILDSDEWQREIRIGQKHLPEARLALREQLRRRNNEGPKGNQPG